MRNAKIDVLIGAAAGWAATWLMDQVTTVMYDRQPEDVKNHENKARGGATAYEAAAVKAGAIFGKDLSERERTQIASAIHWSLGVGAGAMYGLLRNRARLRVGSGLAYGVLFWAAMDEGALTLLGLAPSPKEFPWQTHARGLAGHLVLGAVVELPFDVADLFR